MKFALIFVVFAVCASCAIAENITSWGDVHSTWLMREERVVVPYQFFRRQNRTVTFRTPDQNLIIRGIMHIDYQTTWSTPSISAGGIDTPTASVNILSQRGYGINSTVRFYL